MITTAATISLLLLFVTAMMCLYRLVIGPSTADRALAVDTLTACIVGMICVLCVLWRSTVYFDAVWILTLVGFLGTAAIARYLTCGRVFF